MKYFCRFHQKAFFHLRLFPSRDLKVLFSVQHQLYSVQNVHQLNYVQSVRQLSDSTLASHQVFDRF